MSLFTGGAALAAALIGAGSSAVAGKIGANASRDAAATSAQSSQDALNFLKQQKASQEAAAQPYLDLGSFAVRNLPGAVRPTPMMPASPYSPRPMTQFGQGPTLMTPAQSGPSMVTIKAPDGSTRQVPANQAAFYVNRGGVVV